MRLHHPSQRGARCHGDRGDTEADGNGIGLALVRLMIERAGGRVDLESSPFSGARSILTAPRV
jgi:signal transduction histidine kinase